MSKNQIRQLVKDFEANQKDEDIASGNRREKLIQKYEKRLEFLEISFRHARKTASAIMNVYENPMVYAPHVRDSFPAVANEFEFKKLRNRVNDYFETFNCEIERTAGIIKMQKARAREEPIEEIMHIGSQYGIGSEISHDKANKWLYWKFRNCPELNEHRYKTEENLGNRAAKRREMAKKFRKTYDPLTLGP